jgi:hypothetical protein
MFKIFCLSLFLNLHLTFNAVSQFIGIENTIRSTVERINDSLKQHTDYLQQVRIVNDSVFAIEDAKGVRFLINICKLKDDAPEKTTFQDGISFHLHHVGAHVPVSFINFTQEQSIGGFIKFYATDNAAVQNIHLLFVRMYELMMMRKEVTKAAI